MGLSLPLLYNMTFAQYHNYKIGYMKNLALKGIPSVLIANIVNNMLSKNDIIDPFELYSNKKKSKAVDLKEFASIEEFNAQFKGGDKD